MMIIIKKNKHRCNKILPIIKYNSVSGFVMFEGSFEYSIEKQKDTNKLVGLSDSFHHHINSIRLGWRWNTSEDKLEILIILYQCSKRSIEHLCFIDDLDNYYKFSIEINKSSYEVSFGDSSRSAKRTSRWCFFRYVLFPFFGGTTKSPKQFNFNIDII